MTASDFQNDKSVSDKAHDLANKASDTVQDNAQRAASTVAGYRDQARDAAKDLGATANAKAADLKGAANDAVASVKDQARQTAGDAQDIVSSFADEARAKVQGIIDDQKSRGADQLAGLSRAAQSAAGELEGNNPAVARLVRDAASTVDHLADDLRSTDLRDVIATVTHYARQQPIAFFAASVVAGFALARFVKSEPAGRPVGAPRNPQRS